MEFYKVTATIGHQGAGKSGEMSVYIYAENVSDALGRLHSMPMVKKLNALPLTKTIVVTEEEFFRNTIYNPYYDFIREEDVDECASLEGLAGRLWYLFESGYKVKSAIGKTLKTYCDNYTRASKKVQKRICKEYLEWAESLSSQMD